MLTDWRQCRCMCTCTCMLRLTSIICTYVPVTAYTTTHVQYSMFVQTTTKKQSESRSKSETYCPDFFFFFFGSDLISWPSHTVHGVHHHSHAYMSTSRHGTQYLIRAILYLTGEHHHLLIPCQSSTTEHTLFLHRTPARKERRSSLQRKRETADMETWKCMCYAIDRLLTCNSFPNSFHFLLVPE